MSRAFDLSGLLVGDLDMDQWLTVLDARSRGVEGTRTAPPPVPLVGRMWEIGDDAVDLWADHDREFAVWTTCGWAFLSAASWPPFEFPPFESMS